jgi:ABC-type Zn uptake system ZnuABC Zn-binding protein ZnuA
MTAGIRIAAMGVIASIALGCGANGSAMPDGSASGALDVVATTTLLADLARQAGGDRVAVTSIVPAGGEVHTFDPSPSDAARLADADLIVTNGLGLDEWVGDLATDAGSTAPVVSLAEGLPDATYVAGEGEGGPNPHLWLDPELAAGYVARIGDALAAVDPAGGADYRAATTATEERFAALDVLATDRFAAIPASARRLVAFHDALPYLARAYGIEIVDVVVAAPGQEPSAAAMAAIIDEIRATKVPAVVTEVQFSDDVARSIASETGATLVSDLYTDTLGQPPLDSYEAVMRWNVDRIASALEEAS